MPVPLLLLPPVQHHGNAKNKNCVETDDAESYSENYIEIPVCERRKLADATALLCGNERVGAGVVLDETRGGRVKVPAAVELSSVSTVFGIASASRPGMEDAVRASARAEPRLQLRRHFTSDGAATGLRSLSCCVDCANGVEVEYSAHAPANGKSQRSSPTIPNKKKTIPFAATSSG